MPEEALFAHVAKLHGPRPWGRVLDAGTGRQSLDWISRLDSSAWTAVTADAQRAGALRDAFAARIRAGDRIVAGNWSDESFLHDEVFDVVLADYLFGAVDYFAPYYQDLLVERLSRHVGHRLYVVGLEPYREDARTPEAEVVLEIARLRDACILLAGHRCYREFPAAWMVRQLERAGYTIEDVTAFPIIYGERFVNGQLDVCRKKLPYMDDRTLVASLEARIEALRERALAFARSRRGIRFGEDYVIAASVSVERGHRPAGSSGHGSSMFPGKP